MRKFILITLLCALTMFACNDKDEDDDTDDNEVKDRTTTITGLLDNNSSATVRGVFTKAELESVANTLKTTINALFNEDKTEWGEEDAAFYRGAFARGMIYIVERNPDGYTNVKTTGDGKTVYIALDKIDTGYVRDGMGKAYKNETYIS